MRPDIIVARGLGPVTWFRSQFEFAKWRLSACGVNSSLFDFSGRLPCHLGPRHSGHLEGGAKMNSVFRKPTSRWSYSVLDYGACAQSVSLCDYLWWYSLLSLANNHLALLMHVDDAGGEQHVQERAPASPFVNDSPLRSKEHSRMKRLNWAGDLTIRSIGQSSPARRYTRKSYTSSLCELHCTRSSRVPCPWANWFSDTLQHDSFSMAILDADGSHC
ncbi:hypothetical protein AcV7_007501 [Taiwanofungus camphoratus]|nr:hypothetical protein AcV7_007501 [Antrodia cinnamomea]